MTDPKQHTGSLLLNASWHFGIISKAEVDFFLEFSCFFYHLMDVGNLISAYSAFSKFNLNIWTCLVHVLLKPGLENFEHYFASVWDECNCSLDILWHCPYLGLEWKLTFSSPVATVEFSKFAESNGTPLQCSCLENPRDGGAWWAAISEVAQSQTWLKWLSSSSRHIECSTFTASSFGIWNSSTGIPSPPLALFAVMLSKAHLTSHSRKSGSRRVITPLWLSGSWRSFFVIFPTFFNLSLNLAIRSSCS